MGLIRSGLLVIVSVLLFISLLLGGIFLTLNMSLEYQNVNPQIVPIVNNFINDSNFSQFIIELYPMMNSSCENNSEFIFNSSELGQVLIIPCETVLKGPENIVNYTTNFFIEDSYYKNYDCSFIDCFQKYQPPLFLISEKLKDYWKSKFNFTLIISLILIALVFFLTEKRVNLFFILGTLLIISSFFLLALNRILPFFSNNILLNFIPIFFSKSYTVFLSSLIMGIVIFLIGILLTLFLIGFKISSFFNRKKEGVSKIDVKDIVKEELNKNIGERNIKNKKINLVKKEEKKLNSNKKEIKKE